MSVCNVDNRLGGVFGTVAEVHVRKFYDAPELIIEKRDRLNPEINGCGKAVALVEQLALSA